EDFLSRYNYDISPFMDSVYSSGYEDYLYDYMKLVSDKVLRFYADFDSCLNSAGILSRGQCSGAPVDIISAYSLLDIPEGESMLYEPEFNSIPAAAAALSNKNIVSAETFTCLYGWPRNYIRQEQTADLKLVADALFANGINHIVWHGKAHNHAGQDTTNFYASVHLGDSGNLFKELKEFNSYLETVSHYMKKGSVYTDVAVYLPLEEAWIKGIMPPEKQFIWAWGYYEMRYIYFPEELKGFHPIWINGSYLKEGHCADGVLKIGDVSIKHLYIDTKYIDYEVLKQLLSLSDKGLEITIKQTLLEPGINKHADWDALMTRLLNNPGVSSTFSHSNDPLISGNNIPAYRARVEGEALYVFFADPRSENIKFPLKYGQSFSTDTLARDLEISYRAYKYNISLSFEPNQSLLYIFEEGNYKKIDIPFCPDMPEQSTEPEDFDAPWLVKK
ncbi:MAG: glycosyl hydrolase, partial [Marinilabiliaceae bacterium]|nr:glycosyl hydrolase [Marinilabiliaceae bacterium]